MTEPRQTKPLGRKAYGSIGHLPQSRLGPGDHSVHAGQAAICLEAVRDRHDRIVVQEKLDGSCCAVARVDGQVLALGRAGWLATSSPYELHHLFADWVRARYSLFLDLLSDGERLVGEWLALAHGTLYDTAHPGFDPFIVFDLMREAKRAPVDELTERVRGRLVQPRMLHDTAAPFPLAVMQAALDPSGHGAEQTEGAVYRVERRGAVDFLAKWVRPDKVDGCYLPGQGSSEAVWLYRP